MNIILDGSPIDLATFVGLSRGAAKITLSEEATARLQEARSIVERHAAGPVPVYGLNTGLGANLGHRIAEADIPAFQAQLLEGRMVGIGEPLPEAVCRGALVARIIGAAKGGSGLSMETVRAMIALAARGIAPLLPSIGSIGAGDLALAAHMGGALIGHGKCWLDGRPVPAGDALAAVGLTPLSLQPKDALALANHSTVTVAAAAHAAYRARQSLDIAMAVAALSGEGYGMNLSIFEARLNTLRPAGGQVEAAAGFRRAFAGSSLESPAAARAIQDALSFRTMAPVYGAARSVLAGLVSEIECELNGIADNPVVLIQALQGAGKPGGADMLSTPNFHTPAIAIAFDSLAIALTQAANASAQRVVKLMMPGLTGLPKYLSPVGGASAGFVPMQKTVAALIADIRRHAHPASTDAMPVSDGVEDVAPQTMLAIAKLDRQLDGIAHLTAIEALVAAQAVDLRASESLGKAGRIVHDAVRSVAAGLGHDRPGGADVEVVRRALAGIRSRIETVLRK